MFAKFATDGATRATIMTTSVQTFIFSRIVPVCCPLGALKEEREKGSNELSQHLWNGIFARVPIPSFYGEHSNFSAAMEPGKERILENWEKARGLFLASASDFPLFSRSSQALLAGSKALFGASLLPSS